MSKTYTYFLKGVVVLGFISLLVFLYIAISPARYANRKYPVSANNISQISDWMTFDYINTLFNLPVSFLQKSLNITNTRYPFITVKQYAKESNTPKNSLIRDIQQSIRNYFERKPMHK